AADDVLKRRLWNGKLLGVEDRRFHCCLVSANAAVKTVDVDEREPRVAEALGLHDHLLGVRGSLQERKIAARQELDEKSRGRRSSVGSGTRGVPRSLPFLSGRRRSQTGCRRRGRRRKGRQRE